MLHLTRKREMETSAPNNIIDIKTPIDPTMLFITRTIDMPKKNGSGCVFGPEVDDKLVYSSCCMHMHACTS